MPAAQFSYVHRGAIPPLFLLVTLLILAAAVFLGVRVIQQRQQTESIAEETIPTIKIIPETITAVIGETIVFSVFIDTAGRSIVGADVDLIYDPAALMISEDGVDTGSIFQNYIGGFAQGIKVATEAGKISLSGLVDPNDPNPPAFSGEAGLFATIRATVQEGGTLSVDFTRDETTDSNLTEAETGNDILAQVKSSTVIIEPRDDEEVTQLSKKIMLLIFDPILENRAPVYNPSYEPGVPVRLSALREWQDPDVLSNVLIGEIRSSTHDIVQYSIVDRREVDGYPEKFGGFVFTDDEYLECLNTDTRGQQCNDGIDYRKLLRQYDVCSLVNRGEIDELWLWGGPWFGFFESAIAGPEGFWYNGAAIGGTDCEKRLPIMGFNYEVGRDNALHSFSHRTEATMTHVYSGWDTTRSRHVWDRYGHNIGQSQHVNVYGCGSVHYPPNGRGDYDYTSQETVKSACVDWENYPAFQQQVEDVNCTTWGCSHIGFLRWWLRHIPHVAGSTDGKLNNWWRYVVDIDNTHLRASTIEPTPIPSPRPRPTPTPLPELPSCGDLEPKAYLPPYNPSGEDLPPAYQEVAEYYLRSDTFDGRRRIYGSLDSVPSSVRSQLKALLQQGTLVYQTLTPADDLEIFQNRFPRVAEWYFRGDQGDDISWTKGRAIDAEGRPMTPPDTVTNTLIELIRQGEINVEDVCFSPRLIPPPTPTPSPRPSPTPFPPPLVPPSIPISGDYNNDRVVNALDFSVMVSNWGRVPEREDVDLNDDARVNTVDYGILLQHYDRGTASDEASGNQTQ